jgi:CelD/BcsL family acetyltransferase involved in cellulose biosynthesis
VYHSSWRDEEAYPGFIRGLAESAARAGSLRLGLLYADGIPVAAQFWLVHAGVASIYKIAYVEKFAKFSVGTVLTAHMMRQALDVDRVSVVDYLSGDDDYKKDWMSHRRERWGILAFNLRSLRGIALAGRHLGGRRIKQMLNHMKKWKARKGESTSGHGGHAK